MLFDSMSAHDYIRHRCQQLLAEVRQIPDEQIIRLNPDQTAAEMAAKYEVDCPVLGSDFSYDDPPLSQDTHSDFFINVYVPFTGDKEMFRCHGSQYPMIREQIEVMNGELELRVRVQRAHLEVIP